MSEVAFIYPNASSHLVVNYIDTVNLVYSTPWPHVNIWVYCLDSTYSQYHDFYQTYDNPLAQSGLLTVQHIGLKDDMQNILQYPTSCWFKIADSRLGNGVDGDGNGDVVSGVAGGDFTLKDLEGVPPQTWGGGIMAPTPSGANNAETATTVPKAPSNGSNFRLSTGAEAGIGVSVGVLCVAMASLAVYIFMLRRRLRLQDGEVSTLKAMKATRDWNESKYTRKELPSSNVPAIFEADEGQQIFEAEGPPTVTAEPAQLDT